MKTVVGGAALVDNLNKALQISMDVYYLLFSGL